MIDVIIQWPILLRIQHPWPDDVKYFPKQHICSLAMILICHHNTIENIITQECHYNVLYLYFCRKVVLIKCRAHWSIWNTLIFPYGCKQLILCWTNHIENRHYKPAKIIRTIIVPSSRHYFWWSLLKKIWNFGPHRQRNENPCDFCVCDNSSSQSQKEMCIWCPK